MATNDTKAATTKGFKLACPLCGSEEDPIFLYLHDVTTMRCDACDETFAIDEAVDHFTHQANQWMAVARWIEQAPVRNGEGGDE